MCCLLGWSGGMYADEQGSANPRQDEAGACTTRFNRPCALASQSCTHAVALLLPLLDSQVEVSKEVLAAKVQDVSNGNWWFNPKDGKPDPFWATLVERCGKVMKNALVTHVSVFLYSHFFLYLHYLYIVLLSIHNVAPFLLSPASLADPPVWVSCCADPQGA